MKNSQVVIFLCFVIVLVCFPGVAKAGAFEGGLWSGISTCSWGEFSIEVAPYVKVGYEQIGLNMNLPTSSLGLAWILERKSLDLELHNAGVWMGEVGLNERCSHGLFSSLSAAGSVQKNVSVLMPQNAFGNWTLPALAVNSLNWNGSQFEYWSIDGNAGFTLRSDIGIIGGLRFYKMSMKLGDPSDQFGQLLIMPAHQFFADFSTNVWIPYLGIKVLDSHYNFSVIATPLAKLSVKVPLTFIVPDPATRSSETST